MRIGGNVTAALFRLVCSVVGGLVLAPTTVPGVSRRAARETRSARARLGRCDMEPKRCAARSRCTMADYEYRVVA